MERRTKRIRQFSHTQIQGDQTHSFIYRHHSSTMMTHIQPAAVTLTHPHPCQTAAGTDEERGQQGNDLIRPPSVHRMLVCVCVHPIGAGVTTHPIDRSIRGDASSTMIQHAVTALHLLIHAARSHQTAALLCAALLCLLLLRCDALRWRRRIESIIPSGCRPCLPSAMRRATPTDRDA